MRPNVRSIAAVVVLVAAAAGLAALVHAPAAADSRGGDVVMIRCNVATVEPVVGSFQGSTSAPGKKSGNCAESLSLLMRDGFQIRDIGHYDDEKLGFVLYTLVR